MCLFPETGKRTESNNKVLTELFMSSSHHAPQFDLPREFKRTGAELKPVSAVLQVYLGDFGLAYRYAPDGKLKEYKEDPKKCHDGTIEFTSIDAHKGVCRYPQIYKDTN